MASAATPRATASTVPAEFYGNCGNYTILRNVICPLCGTRRARRGCPAVGRAICAICCGTKRLVQIQCPADCPYLASARDHPAAAAIRQQQRDVALLTHCVRDFNQRQSQLFLMINTFLHRYSSPQLHPLIDDDVAEAAAALAGTFETAARGVIYEHRPAALPAGRLASALKPLLAEAGKLGGTSYDRDAAVVLRRVEEGTRQVGAGEPSNKRAYLELIGRLLADAPEPDRPAGDAPDERRLIVP
jgi:hypothetical protein